MALPTADDIRLTTGQLAKRWVLTIGTLKQWRSKGLGPKFVKIGKKRAHTIFYRWSDVLQYEMDHTVKTEK